MADDFSSIFHGSGGDFSQLDEALKGLGKMSKQSTAAINATTKSMRDKMKLDLSGIKDIKTRIDVETRYASMVKITGKALLESGGDMDKFTKNSIEGMREGLRKGTIKAGDVMKHGGSALPPGLVAQEFNKIKDFGSAFAKKTGLDKVNVSGSKLAGGVLSPIAAAGGGDPATLVKGAVSGVVGGVQFLASGISKYGDMIQGIGKMIGNAGIMLGPVGWAVTKVGAVIFDIVGSIYKAIAKVIGEVAGFLGEIAKMGIDIMMNWARISRQQLEASNTYLKQVDSSGRTMAPNFMKAMSGADSVAKGHGLGGMLPENMMKEMTLFATQGMRAGFNGVTAESMVAGLAIKRGLLDGVSGFEEMAATESRYKGISMKATSGMLKVMQDGASKVGLSWQKIGSVFTNAVNEASEFGIGQSEVGSMMRKLINLDVELRNSGIDLNKKMSGIMKDLTTGTAKFGDGLTAYLGMRMGATDAFSGMTQARYGKGAAWTQDSSGKFTMTGSSVGKNQPGDAGLNMVRESWKIMSESVRNKGLSGDAAMFQLKQMGKALMPGFSEATIEALAVSGGSVIDKMGPGLTNEELLKSQLYSEKEIGIKLLTAGEHDQMIQRMMLQLQTTMFNALLGVLNMVLLGIGRLVTAYTGGSFMGMRRDTLEAAEKANSNVLRSSLSSSFALAKDIVQATGMDPKIFKATAVIENQFANNINGKGGLASLMNNQSQYDYIKNFAKENGISRDQAAKEMGGKTASEMLAEIQIQDNKAAAERQAQHERETSIWQKSVIKALGNVNGPSSAHAR